MRFSSQLDSTRFFFIQEGVAIALFSGIFKTFFATYPIMEVFGFIGPMLIFAYGLKTWGHTKENNEQR